MDWPTAGPLGFPGRRRRDKGKSNSHAVPPLTEGWDLSVISFNIRRGTAQDGRNHWVFRRHLVHEILKHYRVRDVIQRNYRKPWTFRSPKSAPCSRDTGKQALEPCAAARVCITPSFMMRRDLFFLRKGPSGFPIRANIPGSKGWGNIMPRNYTWVRLIDKKSKRGFYFYNAHLDHLSQRSRKKSVFFLTHHIHGRLLPDPFILTGDFNAREKSRPYRVFKRESPFENQG